MCGAAAAQLEYGRKAVTTAMKITSVTKPTYQTKEFLCEFGRQHQRQHQRQDLRESASESSSEFWLTRWLTRWLTAL